MNYNNLTLNSALSKKVVFFQKGGVTVKGLKDEYLANLYFVTLHDFSEQKNSKVIENAVQLVSLLHCKRFVY